MNRIISLFLFIFVASCLNAQYNTPIRNKVTLGKQTTADGLVWRGIRADTTSKIVPFSDTSAYIILDTVEKTLWLYKAGQIPKWQQVGGSTLDTATMLLPYYRAGRNTIIQAADVPTLNQNTTGSAATLTTGRTIQTNLASTSAATFNGSANITPGVTGTLPVANGGTNRITMPNNYILFGDGNGIDTSNQLVWDRTYNLLGVGTKDPIYKLDVRGSYGTVAMRMESNTADDILLYFTGNVTGNINMFTSAVNATGTVQAQFVNANTYSGSAYLNVQVPNGSTGDPYLLFTTSGGTNYSFGIDNDDSDKFKLHSADSPSNSDNAIYTLTKDGKFGIQTESPSEVLHVVGNARISGLANAANPVNVQVDVNGVLVRTSSIDIKEDVQNLPYGLNEIMLLQPSKFSYIDKYKYGEGYDIGFIAQDVNNVIPEAVGTGIESDIFMDSVKLIPVLTKAIQEQQALIKALEQRILILENK